MSTLLDSTLAVAAPAFESGTPEIAAAAATVAGRRVLHVGKFYPPHMGGMETHLQTLSAELGRVMSVEVLVAGDERGTRVESVGGIRVTRAGTWLNFSAAPVCPRMVRRIRQARADLVHLHLPNPTAILALLASGYRGPLVCTYHSDIIRQKFLGACFWPVLKKALARADAIIVGSPNYLESSGVLRRFREKCRIIPFGIRVAEFQRPDAARVESIRAAYGPRLVLAVGRLVYYKGFEHLIRAMRDVEGRLLIVGDGPLREELKRDARGLGLDERVTFLTGVEDVRPYYHSADVFVLPSIARSEAFGLVQLEAMAAGLPVVNTQLDSGVTFVSQHGLTGLTVPPADAEALGEAINTLLDDPPGRTRYGLAGRLRVEEEFSLEQMTRRTLKLYAEVLGRREAREKKPQL